MLWPRRYIQTSHCVEISFGGVVSIIRVGIISNWMDNININTVDRVNHFGKSTEANPRIVIDINTKILVDRSHSKRCTTFPAATQQICLVELMHTKTWHVD